MKCAFAIMLAVGLQFWTASGFAAPDSAGWVRTKVGPDSETWVVPAAPAAPGQPVPPGTGSHPARHVVALETGMNYWDGTAWSPSDPSFDASEDAFVANKVQHRVRLEPNLNVAGAVTVVTPDGITLHSTPVAIALYDAQSGNSLLIATLTNCVGVLLGSNQVVYKNAFSGVCGDMLFTLKKGSFEADFVLNGRLDPAAYGFPANTTRIQVITEFYTFPNPDRIRRPLRVEKDPVIRTQMASPDFVDQALGFGEFVLGPATAFGTPVAGDVPSGGAPVAKDFVTTGASRTFLVESVRYPDVQSVLQALPDCNSQGAVSPPVRYAAAKGAQALPAIPAPPARGKQARLPMARGAIAAAATPRAGLAIPYRATISGTLNSSVTWQGDTTYLVSGVVTCNGAVTIEGGAVFKYANNASISVNNSGTLTCKSSQYRPIIFTGVDDDSAGDSMSGYPYSGYTGTISTAGYANPAIALGYFQAFTSVSNCCFRYAKQAVSLVAMGGGSWQISHAQFVKCVQGVAISGTASGTGAGAATLTQANNLSSGVPTFYNLSSTIPLQFYWQNCTIDQCSRIVDPHGTPYSLLATNSIFANVSQLNDGLASGTVGGDVNGFYPSQGPQFGTTKVVASASPFQTVGAAGYYLAAVSGFLNVGTRVNMPAGLLSDLGKRTTQPPILYYSSGGSFTTSLNLSPKASRDNGTSIALGYHYDPLDYVFAYTYLQNATITALPGTAIGTYSPSSSFGLKVDQNGQFICEGTAQSRNWIVRYNTVQEQSNNNWSGGPGPSLATGMSPAPYPVINCRFTDFSVMAQDTASFQADGRNDTATPMPLFQDCQFHGGTISSDVPAFVLQNCLLERVFTHLQDWDNNIPSIRNCLFYFGTFDFIPISTPSALVQDNLFDHTAIPNDLTGWGYNGGFNAFVSGANRLLPAFASDYVLTASPAYQPGALGSYYLPSNSPIINRDTATTPEQVGLYHYTTQASQIKDGATPSALDIGYHYVALNASGVPFDSNGDGTPDYVQDANGNGIFDPGETCWTYPDSDYDGVTDRQELTDGTNPADPSSVNNYRLGYWRFETTAWLGEQGQAPLSAANLQSAVSWNGKSVKVDGGGSPAQLTYKEIEDNALLSNINCRNGTIRFWFQPNWASGTGPGSAARLIEMGNQTGTGGWWSIYLDSAGSYITFATWDGVQPGITYNLAAPINWQSGDWHQIVLTYGPGSSVLYLDGSQFSPVGTGVAVYPNSGARGAGFSIGSDKTGNLQAKGQFDELETFNYQLTADKIQHDYQSPKATITATSPTTVWGGGYGMFTVAVPAASLVVGGQPIVATLNLTASTAAATDYTLMDANNNPLTITSGTTSLTFGSGQASAVIYVVPTSGSGHQPPVTVNMQLVILQNSSLKVDPTPAVVTILNGATPSGVSSRDANAFVSISTTPLQVGGNIDYSYYSVAQRPGSVNANTLRSGSVRITRADSDSLAKDLVVHYLLGGTASNGVDYNNLPGVVTIPHGYAFMDISITPPNWVNTVAGFLKSARVILSPSDAYQIDSTGIKTGLAGTPATDGGYGITTVNIDDSNTPTFAVIATQPYTIHNPPSQDGAISIVRYGSAIGSSSVSYSFSSPDGTAFYDTGYTGSQAGHYYAVVHGATLAQASGSITFSPFETNITVAIPTLYVSWNLPSANYLAQVVLSLIGVSQTAANTLIYYPGYYTVTTSSGGDTIVKNSSSSSQDGSGISVTFATKPVNGWTGPTPHAAFRIYYALNGNAVAGVDYSIATSGNFNSGTGNGWLQMTWGQDIHGAWSASSSLVINPGVNSSTGVPLSRALILNVFPGYFKFDSGNPSPIVFKVQDHGGSFDYSYDSDGDHVSDWLEVNQYGTDPYLADTDGDGLNDDVEINTTKTNPLLADTDGDGIPDGVEIARGWDPLNPNSPGTLGNSSNAGDGMDFALAGLFGINPNVADNFGDGLGDFWHVAAHALATNSDGDTFTDFAEIDRGTSPADGTTPAAGLAPTINPVGTVWQ